MNRLPHSCTYRFASLALCGAVFVATSATSSAAPQKNIASLFTSKGETSRASGYLRTIGPAPLRTQFIHKLTSNYKTTKPALTLYAPPTPEKIPATETKPSEQPTETPAKDTAPAKIRPEDFMPFFQKPTPAASSGEEGLQFLPAAPESRADYHQK